LPSIAPKSLDHVALWVAERGGLAAFLCDHLGMHVIESSDEFTLVGVDALQGKLTLFASDGPRDPGVLDRVALRVSDLDEAVARLPRGVEVERVDGEATFSAPGGLRLGLVRADGLDYDLDRVVLRVPDPDRAADELSELGFARRDGALEVSGRTVVLEPGDRLEPERPLLNHLALLVESASELRAEVERRGIAVEKVVDAPNTYAVFLRGPAGILIEYVEHKPGFSLV
jgi:catechol 2,3-dioxygenase-like lactoylglutathione lyase family enzyme